MNTNRGSQVRVRGSRQRFVVQTIISFFFLILVWHLYATYVARTAPAIAKFVPSPLTVIAAAGEMLRTTSFWSAVLVSNIRVVVGFGLAALLAIPLGIWIGAFPKERGFAGPVTDFARYIPVAAIVPLAILMAGTGEAVKVVLLFLGTFFQLVVMISDNVRRVDIAYVESGLTLGANDTQVLTRVLLPAASPAIFDSLRVGIGFTWSYLTIAEIVAAQYGLGYVLVHSQRFLRTPQMFVVIIMLGLLGLLYDAMFVFGRRLLFSWTKEDREN